MTATKPSQKLLEQAAITSGGGYSVDRILADPQINSRFLSACRDLGITLGDTEINLALLNRRKHGQFVHTTTHTRIRDQEQYAFASEIAIRALERKHGTSLDCVLCDPVLASEFDNVAKLIAPGFSSLEYRWSALRLRKKGVLKPELLARVVPSSIIGPIPLKSVSAELISKGPGVYALSNQHGVLYIGEAQNLWARVRKHLDHSDNKLLARYLWEFGHDRVYLECHLLAEGTPTKVRRALEQELIKSRRAEFNVMR